MNVFQQLAALRYSPDQPRDPDGRFGEGLGTSSKTDKPATKELKGALKDWCGYKKGAPSVGAVAENAIRSGKADSNVLVQGIRSEQINYGVYRGMLVHESAAIANAKVGDKIQIMPASFTYSGQTAIEFATGRGPDTPFTEQLSPSGKGSVNVVLAVDVEGHYDDKAKAWKADKPIQGIDVNKHYKPATDEQEVITGGHFEVTKVEKERYNLGMGKTTGLITVHLKQTGVF